MSQKIFDHLYKLSLQRLEKNQYPSVAILAKGDQPLMIEYNRAVQENDPTKHAEICVIGKYTNHIKSLTVDSEIELYTVLEPCLMCQSACYWAGIREINFAISKHSVDKNNYEGKYNSQEILQSFNRSIKFQHINDQESKFLGLLKEWEKQNRQDYKYS